jgi:hypothetical protein
MGTKNEQTLSNLGFLKILCPRRIDRYKVSLTLGLVHHHIYCYTFKPLILVVAMWLAYRSHSFYSSDQCMSCPLFRKQDLRRVYRAVPTGHATVMEVRLGRNQAGVTIGLVIWKADTREAETLFHQSVDDDSQTVDGTIRLNDAIRKKLAYRTKEQCCFDQQSN